MQSLEGFILAGGASSRMGTDKSQLVLGGQTFVERVATALSSVTNAITVVGKRHANIQSSLRTVSDIYEQWGALGGLHAALSACRADWAVVVACDLPFVTGELLARLASLRDSLRDDLDVVVPVQRDGRPQPLCAIYRVGPCLKIAEKLIQSGEHRPIALLQSGRTSWVAFEELADLDGANRFFDNMNTPGDYARAQKGDGYQAEAMN
jgi:molybdenum cofactor guanylyltransferase